MIGGCRHRTFLPFSSLAGSAQPGTKDLHLQHTLKAFSHFHWRSKYLASPSMCHCRLLLEITSFCLSCVIRNRIHIELASNMISCFGSIVLHFQPQTWAFFFAAGFA